MQVYRVGGAVRDMLLGLEPKDIDYVVVGATPEYMLANGYQLVGASFPVFLKDGQEYALARREKKVGVGYNGFVCQYDPQVTLEEDLCRRDLTINSMAQADDGTIIDYYGGQRDLKDGILRHVSDAFAEDPVRVLRTARFAARYGFTVDRDTLKLMERVAPELNYVPTERIWAEFAKGLSEAHPTVMGQVLNQCKAFEQASILRPYRGFGQPLVQIVDTDSMVTRFAVLATSFEPSDYEKYNIPIDFKRVHAAAQKHALTLTLWPHVSIEQRVATLNGLRAFNDSTLLDAVQDVVAVQRRMDTPQAWTAMTRQLVNVDINAAKLVDTHAIAAAAPSPSEISRLINEARCLAIADLS